MRRPYRSARLAVLCLFGEPARTPADNAIRCHVFPELVRVLPTPWHPLDAIILPGAFVRMTNIVARSSMARCRQLLAREPLVGSLLESIRVLRKLSPGLVVVVGVRFGGAACNDHPMDATCAFDQAGLVGMARPVTVRSLERSRPSKRCPAVGHFISLPNRSMALLSVGLDFLAVSLTAGSEQCEARALADWASLVADHRPDAVLVTLPTLTERQTDLTTASSLMTASASLGGAFVVASGHMHDFPASDPVTAETLSPYQVSRPRSAACAISAARSIDFRTSSGFRGDLSLFVAPSVKRRSGSSRAKS